MTQVAFPESNRIILVASNFDARLEALLEAGETLARTTASRLRLVHVCDPWTKSALAAAVESGPPDLVQALKDEATRVATRRLAQVAASLPPELRVETEVLSGDVVKSITADAEANEVGIILMGARVNVGSAALGLSTAVSMIMAASVPVMVLNETARFRPPSRGGLKILVADDFTAMSAAALALGFALAQRQRGASLFHVHVESYFDLEELRRPRAPGQGGRPVTPETIEYLHRQAADQMQARGGDGPARLQEAGGAYHQEIVSGAVADELERSAVAARADLAIFGQHRVFHRPTMQVGQVPFKAMLAQSRAVIVVPGG